MITSARSVLTSIFRSSNVPPTPMQQRTARLRQGGKCVRISSVHELETGCFPPLVSREFKFDGFKDKAFCKWTALGVLGWSTEVGVGDGKQQRRHIISIEVFFQRVRRE